MFVQHVPHMPKSRIFYVLGWLPSSSLIGSLVNYSSLIGPDYAGYCKQAAICDVIIVNDFPGVISGSVFSLGLSDRSHAVPATVCVSCGSLSSITN